MIRGLVRTGAVLAWAGAAHAALNAQRLRRPAPLPSPTLPPLSPLSPAEPGSRARVTVLVPARDEATNISACVRAIGADVLVLDDGSGDGTAELARAAGARILAGTPPPPGWLGKPWACAQLAAATEAEVLVFVDADVRLAPGAVERAVRLLATSGLDVICPFPRQVAETPLERLVQPLLQWSWLTTLPLRVAEHSPRPSLTAACGQFVVIRRTALEAAGGFAAVRGAVLDDLALVRAVKAAGGRGGVVDGTMLATCRMYAGAAALRDGYRRSLWVAFGSPGRAAAVAAGLGLVYVLPPAAALFGSRAGLAGYLGAVASRVIAARRTGGRAWPDALGHPASIASLGYLTLTSILEHRRGRLSWKGRSLGDLG